MLYDSTNPNPDPLTDEPATRTTYTIGDDVITEKPGTGPVRKYLLYDGHGSIRQLADDDGSAAETTI